MTAAHDAVLEVERVYRAEVAQRGTAPTLPMLRALRHARRVTQPPSDEVPAPSAGQGGEAP